MTDTTDTGPAAPAAPGAPAGPGWLNVIFCQPFLHFLAGLQQHAQLVGLLVHAASSVILRLGAATAVVVSSPAAKQAETVVAARIFFTDMIATSSHCQRCRMIRRCRYFGESDQCGRRGDIIGVHRRLEHAVARRVEDEQ
ncbi:MAG: hypothetical protein V9E82_10715 [Candidatus Nanopelagicales bacterium]